MSRRLAWPTLLWLLAPGCAAPDAVPLGHSASDSDSLFSLRDSSGVEIAESLDSAWTTATAWTVDSEPVLEIGGADGGEQGVVFGSIGPVVGFSDGRIAVGDQQALEIVVFAADGTLLGRWSGPGDGPGETRRLDDLAVLGSDELVLTNAGLWRHEFFRPDGTHTASLRAPASTFFETRSIATPVAGWLGDGHLVVGPVVRQDGIATGPRVVEGEWHIIGRDGVHGGLLARLPSEMHDGTSELVNEGVVFYAPRAVTATAAAGLWYAWPDRWELQHHTAEGLQRRVRLDRGREAVPPALLDHFEEWYENGPFRLPPGQSATHDFVQIMRARVQREGRGLPARIPSLADSLPALSALMVSRDGYLWIEEHATATELLAGRPDQTRTGRWTVVDPEGRWLGTVQTPEGLRVEEIGADYVLGAWVDEWEVEHLRMHRINR